MKKILGLDLGTTSIGWAFVHEAENENEESSIIKTGVRVVPLSSDEQNSFERGQSITTNADRTAKRQARRNKFRYQLRRKQLKDILMDLGFINEDSVLTEDAENTTFETHRLRAKAVNEKIEKEEFARVLLAINKKRGYKSSRKTNNSDEDGSLVDGMNVAKFMQNNNLTPGQYAYNILQQENSTLPEFYQSDLKQELNRIWEFQQKFYPSEFTEENLNSLEGKNRNDTARFFKNELNVERVEQKGKRNEKLVETYEWRNLAVSEKLDLPILAHIITELNNEINQSSGYLNAISDRSKELYFNNETVGQYQYRLLTEDPHNSLKNRVFYRSDYEHEFDVIFDKQAEFYAELTEEIKKKLKDYTIFYQRKLRSQKGLISICELEGVEREVKLKNGRIKKKLIGPRVVPKSSPIFQMFKVWQNINSIRVYKKYKIKEVYEIDEDTKQLLFQELKWKGKMTQTSFLKWLLDGQDEDPAEWTMNFKDLQWDQTNEKLLGAIRTILEQEGGFENVNWKASANDLVIDLKAALEHLGIDPSILDFDYAAEDFNQQKSYQLWHLLYSYESDKSDTGNKSLLEKLQNNFGFSENQAKVMSRITFDQDYGNLSTRAIRKILSYLEDGKQYDEAAHLAGYNHSKSMTKEENEQRSLKDAIDILKKNSLRNPVVEKILNQMIHVVNAIIEHPELGRPDEIRVELARELKQSADQRSEATRAIEKATKEHDKYREYLKKEIGLHYVSRNDLIKYKLYLELEPIGFKSLYSGKKIDLKGLFFENTYDVEHIIPQAKLFDDSFSNKTIETREDNIDKGNETAMQYVERKYGAQGVHDFKNRVEMLWKAGKISYTKRKKLFMSAEEIPNDFINRDLANTAYIGRKAMELLQQVSRRVTPTGGKITNRLREDWGLINVLKELNWEKYEAQGLTYTQLNKEGKELKRIQDWTKRNDHRHHAMDAIAVAFCKQGIVQYLNTLSAKGRDKDKSKNVYALENKYTYKSEKSGKRKFKKPFKGIRNSAKEHLEQILVSHKAKNKVTTVNYNRIKLGNGKVHEQRIETPRGQLHKETVYAKSQQYETKLEKVGSSFNKAKIKTVAKKAYRDALLKRLDEYGTAKKAFTGANSLAKNPIYLSNQEETVPESVKTVNLVDIFSIRKDVTPENFSTEKKIDKVIDVGIRNILKQRLSDYNGKAKEAFSDLEENPIWLNKEAGISIKRVRISGVRNAEVLHDKRDHKGELLSKDAAGYVSTGNNHHVAIYRDQKGNLQEEVVSFFEAVMRKNQGLPIVNKNHEQGWEFLFTLKQNEMFLFPSDEFDPQEIDLMDVRNKRLISKHMFRVQKYTTKDYWFRHHLESQINDNKELKDIIWRRERSPKSLNEIIKIRLNHLGEIVEIGEY
ncbi:type II CRISPR RNA-guided endonuclease Cas9 [Weeksellaceae bacterium KMM 9713]|uniref:CRISPR-associated endonuclease Cas9 n=1 Tax=Profundicola chukchiensis TaxID=2961959 RepID=A0A9X4MVY1_9FLAO|nr:type II CRISPR RNA-guided endonuclease Cas9 [Profundicola chukchiensis]MDG4945876.1 type II CRISPR RNA-guided endonuclease Cas9 [Profundicola chukchiensis]